MGPTLWHHLILGAFVWVALQVAAPSFLPAMLTAHLSATSPGDLRKDQASLGLQTDA